MEYPHLYMGIRPVNHNKNHVVVGFSSYEPALKTAKGGEKRPT